MLQLVLKFLQSVFRERQVKSHFFIYRLRVADFVRLDPGKIVFLLHLLCRKRLRQQQRQRRRTHKPYRKFEPRISHGRTSFTPGLASGVASVFAPGCRGNSNRNSSSFIPVKSIRTNCSGGLNSSGAPRNASSTSRSPRLTCI